MVASGMVALGVIEGLILRENTGMKKLNVI
jgi:hypothetical protein